MRAAGRRDTDVDPCALVTSVGARFEADARRRGITLAAAVGSTVPERVRADGARLSSALGALVAAALRSAGRGAVVLEIARVPCEAGRVALTFSVTGGGELPAGAGHDLACGAALVRGMGGKLVRTVRPDGSRTRAFTLALERAAQPAPAPALSGRAMLLAPPGTRRDELAARLREEWGRVDVQTDPDSALAVLRAAARRGAPFDVMIVAAQPGAAPAALAEGRSASG